MPNRKLKNWTPDESDSALRDLLRRNQYEEELQTSDKAAAEAYSSIYQSVPIHGLIASAPEREAIEINAITHSGTMESNGILITIDEKAIKNINPQTFKVLILLLKGATLQLPHERTATNADAINRGRIVSIGLSQYMEACRINDIKEARNQLNEGIKALYAISLEWDEEEYSRPEGKSRKVKTKKHHRMRITDHTITEEDGNPIKRGTAEVKLSFDMAEYLCGNYIMPYPDALLSIHTHYHPYSLPLGWKLCALYNVNYGKDRRNITTVKTLLNSAKGIPRYSDLVKTGRIYERLIKPFDRDLYALVEAGILSDYWYFDKNGERIERIQLGNLSYAEFAALSIHYELKDYPDQTQRLEAKNKRIKAAVSRAKTNARKKQNTAGDGGQ